MDHVIDFILNYMDFDKEDFINEWRSGTYRKMSDCPTYSYVKAYCDAIMVLNRLDGRYSGIIHSRYLTRNPGEIRGYFNPLFNPFQKDKTKLDGRKKSIFYLKSLETWTSEHETRTDKNCAKLIPTMKTLDK
ncbi:MAG: hypothetical protein HDQ97_15030 [Lachnospiraceae bacterium]|nr:hypothetical protein [Lachnospiraceae bacterium]